MCQQKLSEWCHTCLKMSGQSVWRINLNDHWHAAFIHVSNCVSLRTDLVHMVQIFDIAYGMSWKSRWRSWIMNGEEVEQYFWKTSEMIIMHSIAGRKCGIDIGPDICFLTLCWLVLIRNWEVTKLLDAHENVYKPNTGCRRWVYDSLYTFIACTKGVSMWLIWVTTTGQRCQVIPNWESMGLIVISLLREDIGRRGSEILQMMRSLPYFKN
jgi:hypothetical protein